jgi:hypothetical protein
MCCRSGSPTGRNSRWVNVQCGARRSILLAVGEPEQEDQRQGGDDAASYRPRRREGAVFVQVASVERRTASPRWRHAEVLTNAVIWGLLACNR